MEDSETPPPPQPVPEPVAPGEEAEAIEVPGAPLGEQSSPPASAEAMAGEDSKTAQMPVNEPIGLEGLPRAAPGSEPAAPVPTVTHLWRDLLLKAQSAIQGRRRKKIEKILEFLEKKKSISNDEVEKLLRVSDATATRYLSILEKEGKIQRVGKTGRGVEYTRITPAAS
jgi:hypothetical protein